MSTFKSKTTSKTMAFADTLSKLREFLSDTSYLIVHGRDLLIARRNIAPAVDEDEEDDASVLNYGWCAPMAYQKGIPKSAFIPKSSLGSALSWAEDKTSRSGLSIQVVQVSCSLSTVDDTLLKSARVQHVLNKLSETEKALIGLDASAISKLLEQK